MEPQELQSTQVSAEISEKVNTRVKEKLEEAEGAVASIEIGTEITTGGKIHKVIEIPTKDNENKYVITGENGLLWKATKAQLIKAFASRKAELVVPEVVVPEAMEPSPEEKAKEFVRAAFAKRGFNIDDIETGSFDFLGQLYKTVGIILRSEELTIEGVKFLGDLRAKLEEKLEIKGVAENRRLPKTEYDKLQEECKNAGLFLDISTMFTADELRKAREILETYRIRFPDNKEIEKYIHDIEESRNARLEKLEEEEQELLALLENITSQEAAAATQAEADRKYRENTEKARLAAIKAQEALEKKEEPQPKTEIKNTPEQKIPEKKDYSTEFIKQKIKELLGSVEAIKKFEEPIVSIEKDILTITVKFEGKGETVKFGMTIPVTVKGAVTTSFENKGNGLAKKDYNIKAGIVDRLIIENKLVPEFDKISKILNDYIAKEEGKEVEKMQIANGKIEVTFK